MLIGIPKETKDCEYRVAITPGGVQALKAHGHKVLIENNAGLGSGITNAEFSTAGAELVGSAAEVWQRADIVMKIKEPQVSEYGFLRAEQILYTYLHLAAQPQLTKVLLDKGVTSVAYETIELDNGTLPLLTPMSEVAGRMATQIGAHCLEKNSGGKGILLGGVPGVQRGHVVIIGGGVAGSNAAKVALGMGARVTIIDIDAKRLAYLDDVFFNRIDTMMSSAENISAAVRTADLLIGTVLVTGARAPVLVSTELIKSMEAGSVVVDVAIDQGGCIETSKVTTHAEPVFKCHEVMHYGIDNIPGCVPRTSSYAITNVTLQYALLLADMGYTDAINASPALRRGINTYGGKITHPAVAATAG
ncbi:MAG: alanine dehydrogenase [Pseudomonadota bacterium]|nr:alanine dehydrogenase [Pseudomonadota bacterium]